MLKADANPERHAHNRPFLVVDAVLNHDLHAKHEQHGEKHHDIGGGHRSGDGQEQRRDFGEESEHQKQGTDVDADHAGANAGQFRHRDAGGVRGIRDGAEEAGEQVAEAVRVDSSLHRPVIHGAGAAP